jgi:hypothetical protein
LLIVIAEPFAGRLFLRRDAVGMEFGNPLITLVRQTQQVLSEADLTLLEQAQIVCAAFACGNRQKLPSFEVND